VTCVGELEIGTKWRTEMAKETTMTEKAPVAVEKMMNLTLHVQKDREVDLVQKCCSLSLERSPQGVYVGKEVPGLEQAAKEVIEKITHGNYKHVLVGGSTGLIAKVTKLLIEGNMAVNLYEFENNKRKEGDKIIFEPIAVRQII
jgi:hypothetical protein